MFGVEIGDLATWVGAGVAFLTALAALLLQLRGSHRSQAEQVALWSSDHHVTHVDEGLLEFIPRPEGHWWHGFVCLNQSAGPVDNFVFEAEGASTVHYTPALPPGERYEGHLAVPYGPIPRLRMEFSDQRGRRWKVGYDRTLSRSKSEPEGGIDMVPVVNLPWAEDTRKPTSE